MEELLNCKISMTCMRQPGHLFQVLQHMNNREMVCLYPELAWQTQCKAKESSSVIFIIREDNKNWNVRNRDPKE